ncbi:MAG: hypothetical protein FWE45_02620 [Firmicutes bacterium]|nr:hypothetical protein [Bacillota bacterium]
MQQITNDLFDIANRLKQIDEQYNVFFDSVKERYEVHSLNLGYSSPNPNTLEFIVPYPILDERTLTRAMRTRKENEYEILAEIEEHNKLIEQSAYDAMSQELKRFEDMFSYAYQTGRDVTFAKRREWI